MKQKAVNRVQRIPSLDGLRAIAIGMVLIGHGMYSWPEFVKPLLRIFSNGVLGVLIFFVLSGYLIHYLTVVEIENTGEFYWKGFYQRRMLRIFPAFYTYIIILCLIVGCGLLQVPGITILSAASYTLNYGHLLGAFDLPVSDYHVIGHYWTLALEEQFYLTWPLMVLLIKRHRLLLVLAIFIASAPLLRVATYFIFPNSRGQVDMMFHTGFDAIAVGVFLGEAMRVPKYSDFILRLAANKINMIMAWSFILLVSPYLFSKFAGSYWLTVGKCMNLFFVCLIVVNAVKFENGLAYKIFNWPPLVFVGVLSYSLYIWNNLFLNESGKWWVNIFPFNYLAVIILGLVSHYFIEKPFLRLKSKFRLAI